MRQIILWDRVEYSDLINLHIIYWWQVGSVEEFFFNTCILFHYLLVISYILSKYSTVSHRIISLIIVACTYVCTYACTYTLL